ncbi:MAG: adenylate/guanylate cyclase domain-containing protein [Rhodocyclaceae bacterium]|nr:adenylate/guanylate cyclase domain-containing protein [Rhodocyclaceae bacterium]
MAPLVRVLHHLLDEAMRQMHFEIFRRILATEVGLPAGESDGEIEALYRAELGEHGTRNLTHACRQAGWEIALRFPADATGTLCILELPFAPALELERHARLLNALGFALDVEVRGTASTLVLRESKGAQTAPPPRLLDPAASLAAIGEIGDQLGYGVIVFSPAGEVQAASPAMLARLRLDDRDDALAALPQAIPPAFFDDVVWGLALENEEGVFENYRIRLYVPGSVGLTILFNVSGFRAADGAIYSLWQVVAEASGEVQLAEGTILGEVRVHNITKNYVPQLVEQKAREAVRLGRTSLANEERPVAVLFCDIVGFTAWVERHGGSESVIETLNTILRRVAAPVKRYRGAIDKFMGDSLMALFDDPADAVRAALDMQSHAADINALRADSGRQALQLRIGIHWGEVVIGNVGTAERLDWTAIGDVVNTASRIEKGCTPGGILVSETLRETVEARQPGAFRFGKPFALRVKGKREALRVCAVQPQGLG